jgi:hypothetical protein
MKKALIASFATSALVIGAFAMSASAYVFSNYLSVGSTGPDVVALQSFLVSKGFLTMPAGVSEGYFGALTKTAVVAYQASVSLPSTGYVGPMTVKVLNAGGSTASTGAATCPAGYSCAQTTPVTFACPSGWTCTPLVGTTAGNTAVSTATGITTPGVAGSLDVSNGSFVGNGTSVNDGQSVSITSFALQSGPSDMAVSSIALDFNVRPWLYMTSLSIVSTNGTVLGTVNNLSQSNFTEITVGSDYRITIPVNFVVPKATRYIVELNSQFGVSNRQGLDIYVSQAEVRSVDGTGVTLTSDYGNSATPTALGLFVDYGGSSASSLLVQIDSSSPNTETIQTNTGNVQTSNILMGAFDFRSQNINATLQALTAHLAMTGQGSIGSTFGNLQLYAGSQLLSSGTFANPTASSSDVTFSNFNLPLPENTPVAVSLEATINGGVNAVVASTSLVVTTANIVGIDANSNNLTIASSGTLPGANLTFSLSGQSLSGLAWSLNTTAPGGNLNRYPSQTQFTGSVTVTAGTNPIYISSNGATALTFATSSTAGAGSNLTATIASFAPSNGPQSNDPVGAYQITGGSSRTFNFNGSLAYAGASTTQILANAGVVSVNLNTAAGLGGGTANPITTLLQGLNSDFHVAGAYLNGAN